jgi:hypothetical protein
MLSRSGHTDIISSNTVSGPAFGGILFRRTAADNNPPLSSARFWRTSACRVRGQNEREGAS